MSRQRLSKSAICLIDYVGLQILDVETVEINSILIIAQKLSTEKVDNSNFMNEAASYRRMSVFPTDRKDFVTQ